MKLKFNIKLKQKIIEDLKRYSILLLGLFAASLAFNLFLMPHNIVATGSFGLVLIVHTLFGFNESTFVLFLNVFLIIFAFFAIGKNFAIKSFAGAVIFLPLFIALIPVKEVLPDKMLSVICAGVLNGVAIICLYLSDGSSGGTTIVGKTISKFAHVKYSTGIAISDGTIVLCGFFIFGFENTVYGLLSIAITRSIAHFFEAGFKKTNCVYIISSQFKLLKTKIKSLPDPEMGIVLLHGENAILDEPREIIMCIISNNKLKNLKKEVTSTDEKALIIVSGVTEIHGKTFINPTSNEFQQ